MEELSVENMTLEEFHQLVLFHLMDAMVPDYARWITIDECGAIYVYQEAPRAGKYVWGEGFGMGLYNSIENGKRISIPDNISWRACKWKL